ncbi:InlB B-repeat-containing protein [Bifidobacterium callitrichos]|nr:InlB B-repeat-containing protein [Bifidobacterium callitrichos]
MTGNNKVWRAPLAGLASLAMLATMGLAASTANADDAVSPETPTINLNANGGHFKRVNSSPEQVVASQNKSDYALTLDELQKGNASGVDSGNVAVRTDGALFTGWYTAAQGGEAYKPGTQLAPDTTLYAHWSKSPVVLDFSSYVYSKGGTWYSDFYNPYGYEPTVPYSTWSNGVTTGAHTFTTYPTASNSDNNWFKAQPGIILLAEGDHAATWQLPYDKSANDGHVDDWNVVSHVAGDFTEKDVPVDYASLKTDFWTGLANSYWKQNDKDPLWGTQRVYLHPSPASAKKVTFLNKDKDGNNYAFTNTARSYDDNTTASRAFNVKDGEAVNVRVDTSEYAAYEVKGTNSRKVTKWSDVEGATYAPADFNTKTVDRDWTLRPSESKLTYTVNFVNGGQTVDSQEVVLDGTATRPADPVRAGYKFLGWTADTTPTTNSKLFDFSTKIDKPTTLYAVWQAAGVAVNFDPNWGTAKVESVTFADGDQFAYPAAPTRDGYEFAGWFTEKPASTVFDKAFKADKYVGVKLRIVTGNKLQYLATTPSLGSNGAQSQWLNLPFDTLYAGWAPAKEATLVEQELNAPAFNRDGSLVKYDQKDKKGDYARKFTESSWANYIKQVEDYQQAKHDAGSLTKDEIAKLYAQLQDAQGELVQKTNVEVVRLRKGAKFLYSSDAKEQSYWKNNGWTDEGVAFYAVSEQGPVASKSVPVYRLRNLTNGDHLLSTDTNEVSVLEANGWASEGVLFYAPQGAADSVKRFWKAGSEHLYTADLNEYKYQTTKGGWTGDDTVFVASKTNVK